MALPPLFNFIGGKKIMKLPHNFYLAKTKIFLNFNGSVVFENISKMSYHFF